MKWRAPVEPKIGDTRTRAKFAFVLTRVGDWVVWWETFDIFEEFGRWRCVYGYCRGWRETGRDTR